MYVAQPRVVSERVAAHLVVERERVSLSRSAPRVLNSAPMPCRFFVLVLAAAISLTSTVPIAAPTARAEDVEHRAVPDLDGRPEPGPNAGDALLWIPRVIFSPLYLVSEFVLRRPLGFIVTEIERGEVIQAVLSFFTFGPEQNVAVLPTALIDFGFSPSVGIYTYWNKFLFDENRISLHAAQWGLDWLSLTVHDTITFGDLATLATRFKALRRPDYIYAGVGYDSTGVATDAGLDTSRYSASSIEAGGELLFKPWQSTFFGYQAEYVSRSFEDVPWGDDEPSAGAFASALGQELPDGFVSGYSDLRLGIRGALDTRTPAAAPQGGVRLGGRVMQHIGLGAIARSNWIEWAGDATIAVELFGGHRVLGVTGEVAFVEPVGDAAVPFTELVDAGGDGPLAGFQPGVLRGQSAAVLAIHYTWPAWVFIDGRIHFEIGNVFGPNLEGFEPEHLRMSFGIGLEPELAAAGDSPFELLFAVGTDTFERGADITSFRLLFGTRNQL